MPNQTETEIQHIRITWSTGVPKRCTVEPAFVARPGSLVTFSSPGAQGPMFLVFQGETPFERHVCEVGQLKVREEATPGAYNFLVIWPAEDGVGNSTGTVERAGP